MANVYWPTKFEANIFIGDQDKDKKTKSKMAMNAIFNFQQMLFWGPTSPHMANVKLHTKFGANQSIIGQDTHVCVFSIAVTNEISASNLVSR